MARKGVVKNRIDLPIPLIIFCKVVNCLGWNVPLTPLSTSLNPPIPARNASLTPCKLLDTNAIFLANEARNPAVNLSILPPLKNLEANPPNQVATPVMNPATAAPRVKANPPIPIPPVKSSFENPLIGSFFLPLPFLPSLRFSSSSSLDPANDFKNFSMFLFRFVNWVVVALSPLFVVSLSSLKPTATCFRLVSAIVTALVVLV